MLFGKAINDADYPVVCPYYSRWKQMLMRCYDKQFQKKQPSYQGCKVCEEWLRFSNFRKWMEQQEWEGCELDKDILGDGKLYSPDTCLFVPKHINTLLNGNSKSGKWPKGVAYNSRHNNYRAQVCIDGKQKTVGAFKTPYDAGVQYVKAKTKQVLDVTKSLPKPVRDAVREKWNRMAAQLNRNLESWRA